MTRMLILIAALSVLLVPAAFVPRPAQAQGLDRQLSREAVTPSVPTPEIAAQLFGLTGEPAILHREGDVPGWDVSESGRTVGHIASTWEIAHSLGYSGRPLDVLVAIDLKGKISGTKLMRHNEPILTLGLSDADIARFVGGFRGADLTAEGGVATGPDMPDIISRATVTTGVIRDSILRTARTLAIGRGVLPGGGINRVTFAPMTWSALTAQGALTRKGVTMSQASAALAGAKVPVPPGEAPFIDLWVAVLDPPTIGRNILGQHLYSKVTGALGPGEIGLFVASRGLYSHRGTGWRRDGVFDRLAIVQGGTRLVPTRAGYTRIDELAAGGAPDFKERSVFSIPTEAFDPTRPFAVELRAARPAADGGEVSFVTRLDYALPGAHVTEPPADTTTPLWQARWIEKTYQVASVLAMLGVLSLILLFQESFVRRPKLWFRVRIGYLAVTLVWLGWVLGGQLSVVQVAAFLNSLLSGFRWETFLIEPVIFTLWCFVVLGVLFSGRGVFCGWLCPFGALQELANTAARRLDVPQLAVPNALHERLWVIKYTLFMAIIGLSFYSMQHALILAEAEPFKTAISMRMLRAWPFVAFVLVLLAAGLFIERFYCRYLCPLGAGLAIPAKLKVFDWLHRRPQCGRECRLCETKCTVGAIDPIGRINPNECVLCLRCQVVMNDADTCLVLKRRARKT